MDNALIMAGGSGTRLWPLSREKQPKQALRLIGKKSLFEHAVDRLDGFLSHENIWVIAKQEHNQILSKQTGEIPPDHFLVEPEGRGTAPAIGLAAIHFFAHDPESVMIVLTADHYIEKVSQFQKALTAASKLAREGFLVTLGITPTGPATGYGYIELGQSIDTIDGFEVYNVNRFVEKPNLDRARRMVSSGLYSWNSGMFVWQVKRILEEFDRQMPSFYHQLMQIRPALGTDVYPEVLNRVWSDVEKQTIDYGIMEHAERVVVIPIEVEWTDVGSWSSLHALLPADQDGNVVHGSFEGINTENCLIFGDQRMIATIGVKDLVIVDTGDALLISTKNHEQQVKEIVERLREQGRVDLL